MEGFQGEASDPFGGVVQITAVLYIIDPLQGGIVVQLHHQDVKLFSGGTVCDPVGYHCYCFAEGGLCSCNHLLFVFE